MRSVLTLCLLAILKLGMAQSNQLSLVASPINRVDDLNVSVLYHHELASHRWQLRSGLGFELGSEKQVRQDEVVVDQHDVSHQLSVGLQYSTFHGEKGRHEVYLCKDVYLNSRHSKTIDQEVYVYYYNFGVRPALGYAYSLNRPLRLFAELRADLNINPQAYSGEGENYDRVYRFKSFDQLAFGVGYRF